MLYKGLHDEGGPPTEDADVYGQSLPLPVRFALNVDKTSRIAAAEKDNLDGLEKAGFKVDFGEDGSGIVRKYPTGWNQPAIAPCRHHGLQRQLR